MKKLILYFAGFLCSALLLSSCSAGFVPLWKSAATLSVMLPTIPGIGAASDAEGNRAVLQGGGYLYIQTETSAPNARLYGPYPVKPGEEYEIRDIPSGFYSFFALIYVDGPKPDSNPIDVPAAPDMETAFRNALIAVGNPSKFSWRLLKDVNIADGQTNTIAASLVPLTQDSVDAGYASASPWFDFASSGGELVRRFIKLGGVGTGIPAGNSLKDLKFSLTNTGTGVVQFERLVLYNADGSLNAVCALSSQSLAAGVSVSALPVAYSSGSEFYVYIEFTGMNLRLDIDSGLANATYTVTYNGNGETGGSVPVDSNAYAINATVTVLGNTGALVKTGYAFNGWNTTALGNGAAFLPGSTLVVGGTNLNLYAQWVPNTYVLAYDGNGASSGAVPIGPVSYAANTAVTIQGNTLALVNPGYTFTGWNTLANGGGTQYAAGSSLTMGTANVTLFARWVPSVFNVTYDGNLATGGTVPVDATSYSAGNTVTVLGNVGPLVRTGYVFSGWNTMANGGGAGYALGNTFMISADITLFAQWTAVPPLLVAAGGNYTYTSSDGVTWVSHMVSAFMGIKSIAYGNGLFVAVGYQSTTQALATSTDGQNWTTNSFFNSPGSLNHVAVNPAGQFLVIGGLTALNAYTSTDGLTWSGPNAIGLATAVNPVWLIDRWYISSPDGLIWRSSTDGVTWNAVSGTGFSMTQINAVTAVNGNIIAGGGFVTYKQVSISSDNGANFTAPMNVGPVGYVRQFAITNANRIIAVGDGTVGQVSWSDDSGTTWSNSTGVSFTGLTSVTAVLWRPAGVIVVDDAGYVYSSSDNGASFIPTGGTLLTPGIPVIGIAYNGAP